MGDMTEIITSAENINAPQEKTPDELFVEWLQSNGFVAQTTVIAPRGGEVNPLNFIPDGWRVAVAITEAKRELSSSS